MTLTATVTSTTQLTQKEIEQLTDQIAGRLAQWLVELDPKIQADLLIGITPVIETEGLSLWCGLTMSRNGKGPDPYRIRDLVMKMDYDHRRQSLIRDAIRQAVIAARRRIDGGVPIWETPRSHGKAPSTVDQTPPRPQRVPARSLGRMRSA